ncbi:mRNA export factor-like [Histomonas meleagridis]|uniref:mRNA export factor-like n=1 Tax=Histomonas meleagridis TaxID=135588 RepID=UPI00355A0ACA|nr:mRNA export factor-like [Histomonas meleagridis]KAH0797652.1 mRNA export factor-like [Histomonas meleagridis]
MSYYGGSYYGYGGYGDKKTTYNSYYNYGSRSTAVKAVSLPDAPGDTVSCLTFSSSNTYLAASSWDSTLRVWQFNSWKAEPKFYTTTHQIPILRCCFDGSDQNVYFGATDGNVYCVSIEGTGSAYSTFSFGGSTTNSSSLETQKTTNSTLKTGFNTQTNSTASKSLFQTSTPTNVDKNLKTCSPATPTCVQSYYKGLGPITGLRWYSRLDVLIVATSCVDPEKGDRYALIFYYNPKDTSVRMDTLRNQLLLYKTNLKIIDIDLYEDMLYICGIESNPNAPSQTKPYLSSINLDAQTIQENVVPIGINDSAHVGQQITSIAATKRGYIAVNTLGDAEFSIGGEYFVQNLFRHVAAGKCALYPANCVAYSPDLEMAIVCSGVNFSIQPASPQIQFINALKGYNMVKPFQGNVPITACAFSNGDDYFVVATGNDWSKGPPKAHQTFQIGIYLQKIPDDVKTGLNESKE